MTIPSRVLGAGAAQLMTVAICGDGSDSLTAAGSTRTDALQLTKVYNNVTSAADGTGVKLPATQEGEVIYVTNTDANPIKIYPYEATSTITGGSSITLNRYWSVVLFATTRTTWQALKGFNSATNGFNYGSFYDTTTQTAAATNTAYAMTFNTTVEGSGVSIGSPASRIVVSNTGVYNIQFSAQLDKTAGATGIIYIWLRLNGTDISNSAGKIAIQGTAAQSIASWNYVLTLAINDYIQVMWSTDDTRCQILASAASAPVPAIPSVILTVTQET